MASSLPLSLSPIPEHRSKYVSADVQPRPRRVSSTDARVTAVESTHLRSQSVPAHIRSIQRKQLREKMKDIYPDLKDKASVTRTFSEPEMGTFSESESESSSSNLPRVNQFLSMSKNQRAARRRASADATSVTIVVSEPEPNRSEEASSSVVRHFRNVRDRLQKAAERKLKQTDNFKTT
jgi:hypothetical protein